MARWISTEYVKALLKITSVELDHFVHLFRKENFKTEIKVYDNGDREVVIENGVEGIPFNFKSNGKSFEFSGSYRISDARLASTMGKAMKQFRGYGIVNRIYSGFDMVYYYENGTVVKIVERSCERERVIYKFTNFNGQLEWIYRNRDAEQEILQIKEQINHLLDERIHNSHVHRIDARLKELSHQLFVLEA